VSQVSAKIDVVKPPTWVGPGAAVVGTGIAGYAVGTAIYQRIAIPLGNAIDLICSLSEDEKPEKAANLQVQDV
jgi:hypothetical protein